MMIQVLVSDVNTFPRNLFHNVKSRRVDGLYHDNAAKCALVAAVGQAAKRHLVTEFGVGEELSMNLVGWCGPRLTVIGQMDMAWGDNEDTDERVSRFEIAAIAMRRGWGVDSFTMLAEAFYSSKPEATRNLNLAEEYAQPSSDEVLVQQALSIIHVEDEGDVIDICAQPFSVELGKKVEFGTLKHTQATDVLRDSEYVVAMSEILAEIEPIEMDEEPHWLAIQMGVADDAGWFLQYDFG